MGEQGCTGACVQDVVSGGGVPVGLFEDQSLLLHPGLPALRAHPLPRVRHLRREVWGGNAKQKRTCNVKTTQRAGIPQVGGLGLVSLGLV